MSRFISAGFAALAVAALAACTEAPVAPRDEFAGPSLSLAKVAAAGDEEQVVPGELLVKFKDGVNAEAKGRGRGLGILRMGYGDAYVVFKANRGQEAALANAFKSDSEVEWAEPNYLRQPTAIRPEMWAFYNPGGLNMLFSDGSGPIPASYASILDADEDNIEGIGTGGSPVTIGSIDTGVDAGHAEFLSGQIIMGKDWVSNDNDPSDTNGHGTHTTGTMVGRSVGVAGVSGAGINVKVYVQRVCGPSGCATSAIINAINAAAAYVDPNGHKLVAINMSLGGVTESRGEKSAIQAATNAGVLVIASAGNSGAGKVACPACDPNAISVAATNWRDVRTSYSQYGKGLDISAPGGECYSNTSPEGCIYSSIPGGYDWYQGTSMAAPQVTGTAGVVASKTGLRGSLLRSRLLTSADDLGSPGTDTGYGAGRVNTYRAITNTTLTPGQ